MTSKAEHQDIKDRFRERISHNNRTNKLKYRGDFLDIGYVMEELTIPKIKALLEEDFPDRAEEDYERWAEVIHNRLRKSYAILILADNTHLIEEFNLQSVEQDDHTLFRQPFLSREHYEEYSFPWNPRNSILAKVLDENQWFIPPQLSSHVHQTFPARHFRFPFVNQPTRIGHGGFGNVFQVEIADGHIEYTAEYNSVRKIHCYVHDT